MISSRCCAGFKRQALHAASLAFDHPRTGKRLTVESPVPADFGGLLEALRTDVRSAPRSAARAACTARGGLNDRRLAGPGLAGTRLGPGAVHDARRRRESWRRTLL